MHPPATPYVFEDVAWLADATRLLVDGRESAARDLFAEIRHLDAQQWFDAHAQNAGSQRATQLGPEPTPAASAPRSSARTGLEVPCATVWDVYARDAYTCRYCGLPTIHANVRILLNALVPDVIPWGKANRQRHGTLLAAWTQCDHLLPWWLAGSASPENLVTACAGCQWGKHHRTLEQVGIENPLGRAPKASGWLGLTGFVPTLKELVRSRNVKMPALKPC